VDVRQCGNTKRRGKEPSGDGAECVIGAFSNQPGAVSNNQSCTANAA
jgi:hypothetical protein